MGAKLGPRFRVSPETVIGLLSVLVLKKKRCKPEGNPLFSGDL